MAKELTKKQESFLKSKQLGHRVMPYVLLIITFCCFGSFLYFLFFQPLLADPFYVSQQLAKDAIKPELSRLLLLFVPILLFVTYITMVATIFISFSYFRAEKRFLNIIEKLQEK